MNEEKALEIVKSFSIVELSSTPIRCCQKSALEMAQWKDEQFEAEKQQLIEKACEWLKDNARNYYSAYATEDRLIEDFKKATVVHNQVHRTGSKQ